MEFLSLEQELKQNAYPGRGIVIGKSEDGKYAVTAYFIMGKSAGLVLVGKVAYSYIRKTQSLKFLKH